MYPVHIVFACNDAYAQFLAICFKSIIPTNSVYKERIKKIL